MSLSSPSPTELAPARPTGQHQGLSRSRRLLACGSALAILAMWGPPCLAQSAPEPETGARVRVLAPSLSAKPVVGTVVGWDKETLLLQLPDQELATNVPREGITRLEVSQGRGNRGKTAAIGAIVGASLGLVLLAVTPEDSCDSVNPWSCIGISKDEIAPAVVGLGVGVGALLGLASGHGEKWTVVPTVQLALSAGRRRHAEIALSVSF